MFVVAAIFVFSTVYLNLDAVEYLRPPFNWYMNIKSKCAKELKHYSGFFLGLKETFFDTSILICLPAIIFGVSFAVGLEPENMKWTKTSYTLSFIRLALGLAVAVSIDIVFNTYTAQLIDHSSIYVQRFIFKYACTTFFIYGIMPTVASAFHISRTSYLRTPTSTESSDTSVSSLQSVYRVHSPKSTAAERLQQLEPFQSLEEGKR